MCTVREAKWTALTGYILAAVGIVLYTQLDRVAEWNIGVNGLNSGVAFSLATTFGGLVTAIVGSVIWARQADTRQPLKVAALTGIASFFLVAIVDVNVHGPSAILMLLVPFSVLNVLSLLLVTRW
jgi:hypothetical protein